MRSIGSLENSPHAKRFEAFLLTEGIPSQMDEDASEWVVWIKDEDQLDRARTLFEEFQKDPDHERYRVALSKAESIQREQEKKRREYKKNLNVGVVKAQKKAPLTMTLIIICGIVAVITGFGGERHRKSAPMQALAYTALKPDVAKKLLESLGEKQDSPSAEVFESVQVRHANLLSGQVWRLVTPIFLHFSVIHLLFNMVWLYQLGRQIENRYSTVYFGALVLFIAVVSNFAQCSVPGGVGGSVPGPIDGSGYVMTLLGGMSGVVFGLLGFIWVKSSIDPNCRLFVSPSTIVFMLAFLVFCMTPMAEQTILANVANWAHGVGMLAGVVAGYCMTIIKK